MSVLWLATETTCIKNYAVSSAKDNVGAGQSADEDVDFSLKQILCWRKFVFVITCAFACVICFERICCMSWYNN